MPRITIAGAQRAPIYGQLRRRLARIDDIRVFAEADPEEAARLAFQYADDFRLFEDIGWDREDPRESIRLTMPPTDLRRVLMGLQAEAEGELSAAARDWKDGEDEIGEEESVAAREACRELLDDLDTELEGRRHGPASERQNTKRRPATLRTRAGRLTTRRHSSLWLARNLRTRPGSCRSTSRSSAADPPGRDRNLVRRGPGGPAGPEQAQGPRPDPPSRRDLRSPGRGVEVGEDRAPRRGGPRRPSRGGGPIR